MILLTLNNQKSPASGWLLLANEMMHIASAANKRSKDDDSAPLNEMEDLYMTIRGFNQALQDQYHIEVVQHYIRFAEEHCYDLLTVIPKQNFFSQEWNNTFAELECACKSTCSGSGFHLGLISLPWVESLKLIKLREDGFILLYDTVNAVA